MLTFRNTNIVFGLGITALAVWHIIYGGVSPWWYVLIAFVYSLIVFYGCYYIGSGFFMPIICSAQTEKKEIAITFDDGPAIQYTPELLSILKAHNAEAAFFCIGNRIPGNESLLKQVYDEGHVIGNHSYSHHFWFDMYSSAKMSADMAMMDNAMQAVTGKKPKLFRPPYGVMNPNLKKAIIRGGYTPVGWNLRSMDTVIKDEQQLLEKVKKGIRPGGIILFHDTSTTTLNILPDFLKEVKNQGYSITRLDKMLHLQPYA